MGTTSEQNVETLKGALESVPITVNVRIPTRIMAIGPDSNISIEVAVPQIGTTLPPEVDLIPMGSSQHITIPIEFKFSSGIPQTLPLQTVIAFIDEGGTKIPVPVLVLSEGAIDPLGDATPHVRVILTNAIITIDLPHAII